MSEKADKFYRLDGLYSSLLLCSSSEAVPELIYWGPRLETATDLAQVRLLQERPLSFASLEVEAPLSLCPEESRGFPASASLKLHRQGKFFVHRLELLRSEVTESFLGFHLADRVAGIKLTLKLAFARDEDVLKVWTEIENTGRDALTLEQVACPVLPLSPSFTEALLLQGRWAGEFQKERAPLLRGGALLIEHHAGRSGPEHFPGCVVGEENFGELSGSLLGAHLAASGNYRIRIERLSDGRAYLQASEYFHPGEMQLAPSETYRSPYLLASKAIGLEAMSQRFHAYLRKHILPAWTRQERPVLANSWEAVYFDHAPDRLLALVQAVAEVGAERFVLDDGWFRARRNDRAGLGDWELDPSIYPAGLHPLIKEVHARGMSFGLWVEPEMISPDSDIFRAHPEWVLQAPGYPLVTARHQLVLNLAEKAAFDHVKNSLIKLLETYPIAYFKWDMNRVLVMAADQAGQAAAHRQLQALYRLMDELLAAFPRLEIESCASGGARADFEILRRCGRIWTSDNNDPLSRLPIHEGFNLFFPPEIMGAHIGGEKAHITARKADTHLRALVALQGQLGFELDLSLAAPEERDVLRAYTALYKQHRGWIAESKVYRISGHEGPLAALGYVSAEQDRSLWWISCRSSLRTSIPAPIKLRGLNPKQVYRLRLENLNRSALARFMQRPPQIFQEADGILTSGELLMLVGIALPVLPPESCLLFSCHALST